MSEINMEKDRKDEPWQRSERPSYLDVKQRPSNKFFRIVISAWLGVVGIIALVLLMTHHFGPMMFTLFVGAVIALVMIALVRDTAAGTREGKSRPAALDMHTPETTTYTAIANMPYDDAVWLNRRPNDP